MCLSIAYKNKISNNNIIMDKVSKIETKNNVITLVDLFNRSIKISGVISKIDLTDNYIIIKESKNE